MDGTAERRKKHELWTETPWKHVPNTDSKGEDTFPKSSPSTTSSWFRIHFLSCRHKQITLSAWTHTHMYWYKHVCYLDNRVEQHHSRLLGDNLFGGEMVLDELWNRGEARSLEAILILPEKRCLHISILTTEREFVFIKGHNNQLDRNDKWSLLWLRVRVHTYVCKLDDEVSPLLIRKDRQDIFTRFSVTLPHQEVSLLP